MVLFQENTALVNLGAPAAMTVAEALGDKQHDNQLAQIVQQRKNSGRSPSKVNPATYAPPPQKVPKSPVQQRSVEMPSPAAPVDTMQCMSLLERVRWWP